MFSSKCLITPKLFFQLHQRWIPFSFGYLKLKGHKFENFEVYFNYPHPNYSSHHRRLTLKHEARYNSWTTWPIEVLDAWGNIGSSLWTTNITRTFLLRGLPSSNASRTSFSTSSCIALMRDKSNRMIEGKTKSYIYQFWIFNKSRNLVLEIDILLLWQQPIDLQTIAGDSDVVIWAPWLFAHQEI